MFADLIVPAHLSNHLLCRCNFEKSGAGFVSLVLLSPVHRFVENFFNDFFGGLKILGRQRRFLGVEDRGSDLWGGGRYVEVSVG